MDRDDFRQAGDLLHRLFTRVFTATSFVILLSGVLLAAGSASVPMLTEGRLRVKVVSAATGRPIAGAVVGVYEANQSAVTEAGGQTRLLRVPLLVPANADQYRAGILPPRPYGLFTVAVTARGFQPLVFEMVNIYPAAKAGFSLLEARLKPIPTGRRELAAYRELRDKGYVKTIVMGDHKLWLDGVIDYYEAGGGAQGAWTAASLRQARETILSFYTLIARGRAAQAKTLLHPAMDPGYVDIALKYLDLIEVRKIGEPDPNPDGRSVFFPVTLRIKVRSGAPVAWETGIGTYYVRLYLVGGEPRIAEITTGP